MSNFVLYRHYSQDGALLYVGVTNDPAVRWRGHRHTKTWWSDVAQTTYTHFESRRGLIEAERAAIIAESPAYNIVHNSQVEQGFRYLGWPENPSEEDWLYVYNDFVDSAEWAPEVAAALPLFDPLPRLSAEALDWCRTHPFTAWSYGVSKAPLLTDSGFLDWLKGRGGRDDGISDVVDLDIRRDKALRTKQWSAQQLWVYLNDRDACSAVMRRIEEAGAEYQALVPA